MAMNRESNEHLSSLMDGEVNRETGRFLIRRLGADDELCATWARYHLARDCLRHSDGSLAGHNLAERLRLAIERENAPSTGRRFTSGWLRPVAGAAIAASVAVMAVLAVAPLGQEGAPAGNQVAQPAGVPAFTSPQSLTPAPASQQANLSGKSAGDSRMNAYLLRHYQAAGSSGARGFVTFVPIVLTPAKGSGELPEQAAEDRRSADAADTSEAR
jgi:sigma-E factor negative regulatory protein RseA